jgi:peptidoglycan-associated lipoprotein
MSTKLGFFLAGTVLTISLPVYAQTTGGQATPAATPPPAPAETRPATTTFLGDTGLWFVPTGEVLGPRKFSFSVYRVDQNYSQGFTNASFWPITFGVGLGERAELFGAVIPVVRIDRDIRPVFVNGEPKFGGAVADYPRMNQYWSGNAFGDIYLGAKINLLSEYRQQPAAVALRAAVKLPTGDDAKGGGTGKTDFLFDAIFSKEVNQRAELAGFAGYRVRGNPDDFDMPGSFRWGFGAGFPTRKSLRLTAELHGQTYGDVTYSGPTFSAIDGSLLPTLSTNQAVTAVALGLTWQAPKGVFIGGGIDWNLAMNGRSDAGYPSETGDNVGLQFRLGYHPGVRYYVPPPPPPPPPPAPPANNPPTVKARCEPCQVEVGKSATVIADAQDADADQLKYKWSAPAGTLQNPADRQTLWTAPMEPGPVPITITVDDGKGGTASDTVTIQVTRPPVKEFVFEDVHFDFDRYSLRPEATRILDEAVKALQENPDLRIEVEGHTCNIGTAEYNLALGERRANAVRDYLTSRGVSAERLRTVSYGEERPKYDNSREETRRLNRRAALVVRVTRQ